MWSLEEVGRAQRANDSSGNINGFRERPEDACRLVKEVRMEHAAPIVHIEVQADPFAKVKNALQNLKNSLSNQ